MKKITLFLFAVLLSCSSYAQLPEEGFEGIWTTGQGPANWKILQNTIGTTTQWVQSPAGNTALPPYQGIHSAYLNTQNVSSGIPEDYLVTPEFNLPVNAELHFFSRMVQALDQGGIYKIKILPEGADANNIANYTDVKQWTELTLNPTQTDYTEVIVDDIPEQYEGHNVRIAFVMIGDDVDRWLIDNVKVVSQCLAPENLSADDVTFTTANLDWDNPSGAIKWEIEIMEQSLPTTGSGVVYNGTLPYAVITLVQNTTYKYYVRALCADGGKSEWAGPYIFETVNPGDSCNTPKIITSLPYTSSDDTSNYFDIYNGSPGGCNTTSGYLNGNDIVYAYTATQTGVISINVANITDSYAGIFVYTACADIGTNCYTGASNSYESPAPDINIPVINVTAGTTYYIVISSWFAQTVGYTINIQEEHCNRPVDLTAANPTTNGITLGWTDEASASSWEYILQPIGTGLPGGNGITANSSSLSLTGLPDSTQFEFYVRADCGNGTFSSWSGPLVFNTLCGAFSVPFFEGFNTDSTSQFCWNVMDNNADGSVWDLDFTYSFYEGDQSAKFDVGGSSTNDDMLISPAIMLTGNDRLKFFYKTQVSGAVAFKVMLSTTGTAPADFTTELSPLTSYAVDDFTEKIINLSDIPVGPVYLAWYVPTGANGGYELMIDNIIVEPMPACAEPTDIAISSLSNNGVQVLWTPGNDETAWEVIVGEPNIIGTPDNTTSGTPSAIPYTAAGLSPSTFHAAYVRAICGAGGNSEWTGPLYFTTDCDSFAVPFFEGFNSDSASQQCWLTVNADGDWASWNMEDGSPFEGDEAAIVNTGNTPNNDWIISPGINLTGNERLKFHYRVSDNTDGETGFKVLLSTTNRDLSDFTEVLIPETIYTNENFLKKQVSLEAYTGTVYIAWQVPPDYPYGSDLTLDNVIVEQIPSCPEPMYLEISNITQTSVELTWEAGNTETEWELLVNPAGEPAPATGISITTIPFTLTALADGSPILPGNSYEVSVKAVCSSTEKSIPSDKVKFTTLISNDNCDTAVNIPVNTGPSCDVYAAGTINGATASPQLNPCGDWTHADDDVWFEFTATSSLHTISIIDITNGASYLMFIVYKGDDCGNLTQISDCMGAYAEYGLESSTVAFNNLEVGTKYTIRIFSAEASTNQPTTFKVCVKVPVTPIAVNNTQYTVPQLVTDVLFEGNCAQVTNIAWSTGTNYPDPDNVFGDNPNGIAYFNKNGSDFPFEEGILLTTGDALRVPGPNFTGMEQGSAVWLGDTDIDQVMEGMLGAPPLWPSTNASVIEFDFVASVPTLSLDFLFASEEYGDFIQCFTWDTFAILLTDDQGNQQNIAVIPGTNIPISVFTISGDAYPDFCPGYNLEWFDKYNVFGTQDSSNTSFAGQTVVMTAVANVEVNHQYHLKIAIAESDNNLDSGVFIKSGIISAIEDIDLGIDMLVATNNALCEGSQTTLQTGLNPASFEFEWTHNGNVIDGETGPDLVVTHPGEYHVKATLIGYACSTEATIKIEFYPSVENATGDPIDLIVCEPGGFSTFDLSQNTVIILNGLNPAGYTITYHGTETNAIGNIEPLNLNYTNTVQFEQNVYVRIYDNSTQCYAIKYFKLIVQDLTPVFTITEDFSICEGLSGTITVAPGNFDPSAVTFSWTLDGNIQPNTTGTIPVNEAGTYEVTINNNGCINTGNVVVTIIPSPVADAPDNVIVCSNYTLPALSNGNNYYTGTNATGTHLAAGTVITSTQTIYIYAASGTVPNCSSENSFIVTIIPATITTVTQGCEGNDYVLEVIFDADGIYNPDNSAIEWYGDDETLLGTETKLTVKEAGIYEVIVTPNEGTDCSVTAEAIVEATTCEIPRGISPNNDGKNDEFDLTDLDVRKLSILNRYGKEVYSKNNYTKEWHGQGSNGDELPTGTYFYIINRTGGESKTGWVYINRQE